MNAPLYYPLLDSLEVVDESMPGNGPLGKSCILAFWQGSIRVKLVEYHAGAAADVGVQWLGMRSVVPKPR